MNPECPKCESASTRRRSRAKTLRHRLMYFLGKFPWECLNCQTVFFHEKRYSRHRHPAGELYTGDSPGPVVQPGSEERQT